MALSRQEYNNRVNQLRSAFAQRKMDRESFERGLANLADQYSQAGPDLGTFETMLNKLTGSKMDQQGQIASARRGDIYAGGLANMMSNF